MAGYLWLHCALGRTTRKGTGSVFRALGFTSCVRLHWPSRSGNIAFLSSWHKGIHHGLRGGRDQCRDPWEGPVQGSVFCFPVPEAHWAEWRTPVARMHVYCVAQVTQPGVRNEVIASLSFIRMPWGLGSVPCETDPNSGCPLKSLAAPLGPAL